MWLFKSYWGICNVSGFIGTTGREKKGSEGRLVKKRVKITITTDLAISIDSWH
jgi:cytochrome c oxidase assembly protein Cox11